MEKEIWKGKFNFGIGNSECGGSHLHTIIYPSFCNLDGRWVSSFKFSATSPLSSFHYAGQVAASLYHPSVRL